MKSSEKSEQHRQTRNSSRFNSVLKSIETAYERHQRRLSAWAHAWSFSRGLQGLNEAQSSKCIRRPTLCLKGLGSQRPLQLSARCAHEVSYVGTGAGLVANHGWKTRHRGARRTCSNAHTLANGDCGEKLKGMHFERTPLSFLSPGLLERGLT